MMHDDANSVRLEPGQSIRVTRMFGEWSEPGFSCNIQGHRSAGMVGDSALAVHQARFDARHLAR